jgi:glycosyltransferase involved in cell wall biosynthesis
MKNILHIMDYAAPYRGNFIRSIQFLEKEVESDGGHLIYLFPIKAKNLDWVELLIKEGGSVYFIQNTFFFKKIVFTNIKLIRSIIRSEHISIIHTHFMNYNYSLFLLKFLFYTRAKIIGHFHNHFLPPRNKYRKLKILITNFTYDLIIGVSEPVAISIKDAGIKTNKILCIYNALDFSRLDICEQMSFSDDIKRKVIMMFGWPFHRKGVDIAIEAVSQLYMEKSNILLVISLAGEKEVFENEIINRLGQIPSWLSIIEPRDDVASYYNATDIFLSASREEGF